MRRMSVGRSTLMTEGPIARQLIAFAVPLLLGNLFQQLYNTADSLIVGNFLGSEALAAVSSSGSLIHLLIGFFNGLAMGAGVVIGRHYGAREIDRVSRPLRGARSDDGGDVCLIHGGIPSIRERRRLTLI